MYLRKTRVKTRIIVISVMVVISFSCGPGTGSTSDNVQERDKVERDNIVDISRNSVTEETSLFVENRSVDPSALPKMIDILSSKKTESEIKLSDFGTKVTYIKLENPQDTALLWDPGVAEDDLSLEFGFDDVNIVVNSIFGMSLFKINGEFIGPISKNSLGITFYNGGIIFRTDEFIGTRPGPFDFGNGCLLYTIANGPEKVLCIMRYSPSADDGTLKRLNQTDSSGGAMFLGDTLIAIKTDRWFVENFDMVAGTGTNSWAGINSPFTGGKKGSFLEIFDYEGDTLCLFSDFDRIGEWKFGDYRNAVSNESYIYKEMFTVKPAYNDTIFRVIPPNRLLPVYIIKYGDQKLIKEEGLRPDIDLSEKYVNYSLVETDDNLFIRYTLNYDCPTNRNEKTVWFYNVLYNKSNGTIIQDRESGNIPKGVLNDIDGGVSFWPQKVGVDGKMAQIISGKKIKERVSSADFRKNWSQNESGKRLISLASGLTEKDVIVMIVDRK